MISHFREILIRVAANLRRGESSSLDGINIYGRQLTDNAIDANAHRSFIGGMWEEVGKLQYDFLTSQGLQPQHILVDVGCGALRGGVHFIKYLDVGHYFGMDINRSLIKAGKVEVKKVGLSDRAPNLLVDDQFRLEKFSRKFDFALSVSVFTHLPMNHIIRCLIEVEKVLSPEGRFYATFFEAPSSGHLQPIEHHPGEIVSKYDCDPFHYSFQEMAMMASIANLSVELVGEWGHPRDQRMLMFKGIQ